ncbi:hypothetical protein [Xenophilus sp. Marseille-Q4582]|uniref:hypothetical protein n=1 Tax=Xenophilus sp. Marseille-Q4582 TaxID=2866600 RepID=UPI001CE46EAB|nr:hypothetical protein [Xenophilus sp. Marseille-Q4582]
MKFALTLSIAALVGLAGCAAPTRTVDMGGQFDEEAARAALEPGAGKIQGNALLRQVGGGVVTCAGNRVDLHPATGYARKWFAAFFGNEGGGYRSVHETPIIKFVNTSPAFSTLGKAGHCDAQGNFEFTQVKDGDWYVITNVQWNVMTRYGAEPQGGTLARQVTVKDGQSVRVVLAP